MKSARDRHGSLPSLLDCWRRKWNCSITLSRLSSAYNSTSSPTALAGKKPYTPLAVMSCFSIMTSKRASGFYLQGRQPIKPSAGAGDIPAIFVIGPLSDLPAMALALQASGKGAIVSEGSFNEESAVSTQLVELTDSVK